MRVIAGSVKGRSLKAPKGMQTRPTTDRVKEAIFSIIHPYIIDSVILDLFSGTGNLGIEALSRGAQKVYFVDNNKASIHIIKENIENTSFQQKSVILFSDAHRVIKKCSIENIQFDIIFMDPPYLKDMIIPMLNAIIEGDLLRRDGIIVIEHDHKDSLPDQVQNLFKMKEKKYGNTMIAIYSEEVEQ